MRRILVDNARRKGLPPARGGAARVDVDESRNRRAAARRRPAGPATRPWINWQAMDPPAADLIKLRFFAGLTHEQAADLLGLSRSAADLAGSFARAWLFQRLKKEKS